MGSSSHRKFVLACSLAAFLVAAAALPWRAAAYTPESPEVKAMVERGLKFLESAPLPQGGGISELGELWLIGIALVKSGKDETHPIVASGVKGAQAAMRDKASASVQGGGMYGVALGVIFLCELDPVKYKSEAAYFLSVLLQLQQAGGGWGYSGSTQGDTSQTQYGVLALWTADQAGLDVPTERIERVCHWLLRTQDVGGGWVYNGTEPQGGVRVNQGPVTHSLTAAGLGSVYICGDVLGLNGAGEVQTDNDGLPPALKLVKDAKEKKDGKGRRGSKFDAGFLRRGQTDGNAWFAKNYRINPQQWPFYYLYGLERYQSFREAAEGKIEREPRWYDDGVDLLKRSRQAGGNWSGDHSDAVSTAFAVLFLVRSTKKAIAKVVTSEGALTGGRGLPTDVTNVKMKGNQVVGVATTKSIDDLLDLLENPKEAELENVIEADALLTLGSDATTRAKQAQRLRKVASQKDYQARIVAVKALAQARDLENVPVLIYALGDPDWRVAKEARDGLRLISRRFDGFDMPDVSTPAQRTAAQQSWKQWYLSIRPEAEFLD